ncbi:alpha/beta hydrolase [Corynebacterium sp. 335C]
MSGNPWDWAVAELAAAAGGWRSAAAVVAGESGRTARLARLSDGRLEGGIRDAAVDAIGSAADALGRDAMMLEQVAHALAEGAVPLAMAVAALRSATHDRAQLARVLRLDAELAERLLTMLPPGGGGLAAATGDAAGHAAPAAGSTLPPGRVLDARDGITLVGYGDVANADRVILFVPGTGSSIDDLPPQEERVAALLSATGGDGAETAVVLFMHDAPSDVVEAAAHAHYPGAAARLRTAAVTVTEANPGAHLHVMGYSHGALVTSQAATGPGLRADSLSFLGPTAMGPGVSTVQDLRLRDRSGRLRDPRGNGARTWAAVAPEDLIRVEPQVTRRGVPPYSPDAGARHIPAPRKRGRGAIPAHGSYFRERATLEGIGDALEDALRRDPPGPVPRS